MTTDERSLAALLEERRWKAEQAAWPDYTDTIEQPETMVIVWDVVLAADRRRQARASAIDQPLRSSEWGVYTDCQIEEDAAIARLHEHLRGEGG